MNKSIQKHLDELKTVKVRGAKLLEERLKQVDNLKNTLLRTEVLEEITQPASNLPANNTSRVFA